MALDDEEFYEKQSPLPLEGVRQLAAFLKTWLCRWGLVAWRAKVLCTVDPAHLGVPYRQQLQPSLNVTRSPVE